MFNHFRAEKVRFVPKLDSSSKRNITNKFGSSWGILGNWGLFFVPQMLKFKAKHDYITFKSNSRADETVDVLSIHSMDSIDAIDSINAIQAIVSINRHAPEQYASRKRLRVADCENRWLLLAPAFGFFKNVCNQIIKETH